MRSSELLLYSVLWLIYYSLYISISFIISNIYHYILRIIRYFSLALQGMKGFSSYLLACAFELASGSRPFWPVWPTCFLSRNSNCRWFKGLSPSLHLVSPPSPSRITHISYRYIVIFMDSHQLPLPGYDIPSLCLLQGVQPFIFNRLQFGVAFYASLCHLLLT